MIRVEVDDGVLADVGVRTGPLWEVFGSLVPLVTGRSATWPYGEWRRRVERSLAGRPAAELAEWFRRLPAPAPSWLTPVPGGADGVGGTGGDDDGSAALAAEVARVLPAVHAVPDDAFARVAGARAADGRDAWCRWFADAVDDYWTVAVAPWWPTLHEVLRDEVDDGARVVAAGGGAELLAGLGARVRWRPPYLELPGTAPAQDLPCTRSLVVVRQAFGLRPRRCVADGDGRVAFSCPSRAAAVLAEHRPADAGRPGAPGPEQDPLVLLLGRGRAAVVYALRTPATTSDLAGTLGMSASTVSQHLATLRAAGVADKRRAGVRVVYTLTAVGVGLVDTFHGRTAADSTTVARGPRWDTKGKGTAHERSTAGSARRGDRHRDRAR